MTVRLSDSRRTDPSCRNVRGKRSLPQLGVLPSRLIRGYDNEVYRAASNADSVRQALHILSKTNNLITWQTKSAVQISKER